jgi:16S rRNA processing protein RimM
MGRVMGPYGVRGWVKVAPFTAATDALADYPTWWLVPREGLEGKAWPVESARVHADTVVAKLAGIDTREAAAVLKGSLVAVPRDALPPLRDDEMYVGDLLGMMVVNRRGETLGKVEAVGQVGLGVALIILSKEVIGCYTCLLLDKTYCALLPIKSVPDGAEHGLISGLCLKHRECGASSAHYHRPLL